MARRWWIAAFGLVLAMAGPVRAADCGALGRLALEGASIQSAEARPAGPIQAPFGPGQSRTIQLPAMCRVKGVVEGAIGFEVWLPEQNWNGRLLSVGNGGFGGSVPTASMADGFGQGYAVTGNDTGHQGEARDWMRDPARVAYWGHSATHLVTAPAKAIVAAFYGAPASHAYFAGCSTGGAQAMEEVEYYPGDYDGVVAGAPGMSYARLMLSFLWGLKATDRPGAALPADKLALLHQAVLNACDARDGVKDGLVGDPEACHFDPKRLQCRGDGQKQCLTAAQVETARLIYQGPRNPRTGEAIYPGFAFGSEADPKTAAASPFAYGWGGVQGPLAQMFAIPLLRDMIYQDPAWDWRRFDWDKDVAALDRKTAGVITAVDPDLRAFAAHGGKLIMYQGWGDPLNAQTLPPRYRDQVIVVFAKDGREPAEAARAVDSFYRLFMAPGVAHCIGGPGPSHFDALSAVRAWVEAGKAPERLVASGDGISRPLCPYPKIARPTGRGDPSEATSFQCLDPRR